MRVQVETIEPCAPRPAMLLFRSPKGAHSRSRIAIPDRLRGCSTMAASSISVRKTVCRMGRVAILAGGASLALIGLLGTPARAQNPPYWVALDNSQPGTPADVVFDANASTTATSFFDVFVHGFWVTPRQGDDARSYQQISVPGLPVMQ